MRFSRATQVSAWAALGLAVATLIYLAVGPAYQGVETQPVATGESSIEVSRVTATYIEFNGMRVVPLLLIPILLGGLSVLAVHARGASVIRRRASLWMCAVALLGFCAVMFLSIGLLYLPAAIALLAAAFAGRSLKGPAELRPSG